MNEYQIVANKTTQQIWYTAYKRRVYFLFRGFWKPITPMYQITYEEADRLIQKDYLNLTTPDHL